MPRAGPYSALVAAGDQRPQRLAGAAKRCKTPASRARADLALGAACAAGAELTSAVRRYSVCCKAKRTTAAAGVALSGKPPWSASPTRTPTADRTPTPARSYAADMRRPASGQDWAQEGAYDEAAYTQPADEAGGAYGADAAYSQHVADDANDYGGQNTAAWDDAGLRPGLRRGGLRRSRPRRGRDAVSRTRSRGRVAPPMPCERAARRASGNKATMEARSKTKSATALQARVRGRNERRKDRDFMRTPNAKAAAVGPPHARRRPQGRFAAEH